MAELWEFDTTLAKFTLEGFSQSEKWYIIE